MKFLIQKIIMKIDYFECWWKHFCSNLFIYVNKNVFLAIKEALNYLWDGLIDFLMKLYIENIFL